MRRNAICIGILGDDVGKEKVMSELLYAEKSLQNRATVDTVDYMQQGNERLKKKYLTVRLSRTRKSIPSFQSDFQKRKPDLKRSESSNLSFELSYPNSAKNSPFDKDKLSLKVEPTVTTVFDRQGENDKEYRPRVVNDELLSVMQTFASNENMFNGAETIAIEEIASVKRVVMAQMHQLQEAKDVIVKLEQKILGLRSENIALVESNSVLHSKLAGIEQVGMTRQPKLLSERSANATDKYSEDQFCQDRAVKIIAKHKLEYDVLKAKCRELEQLVQDGQHINEGLKYRITADGIKIQDILKSLEATQSSMATAQEQHFQELAELREKYCTLKQFVADSNLQLHKLHDQESSSVRSSSVSTQCGTEGKIEAVVEVATQTYPDATCILQADSETRALAPNKVKRPYSPSKAGTSLRASEPRGPVLDLAHPYVFEAWWAALLQKGCLCVRSERSPMPLSRILHLITEIYTEKIVSDAIDAREGGVLNQDLPTCVHTYFLRVEGSAPAARAACLDLVNNIASYLRPPDSILSLCVLDSEEPAKALLSHPQSLSVRRRLVSFARFLGISSSPAIDTLVDWGDISAEERCDEQPPPSDIILKIFLTVLLRARPCASQLLPESGESLCVPAKLFVSAFKSTADQFGLLSSDRNSILASTTRCCNQCGHECVDEEHTVDVERVLEIMVNRVNNSAVRYSSRLKMLFCAPENGLSFAECQDLPNLVNIFSLAAKEFPYARSLLPTGAQCQRIFERICVADHPDYPALVAATRNHFLRNFAGLAAFNPNSVGTDMHVTGWMSQGAESDYRSEQGPERQAFEVLRAMVMSTEAEVVAAGLKLGKNTVEEVFSALDIQGYSHNLLCSWKLLQDLLVSQREQYTSLTWVVHSALSSHFEHAMRRFVEYSSQKTTDLESNLLDFQLSTGPDPYISHELCSQIAPAQQSRTYAQSPTRNAVVFHSPTLPRSSRGRTSPERLYLPNHSVQNDQRVQSGLSPGTSSGRRVPLSVSGFSTAKHKERSFEQDPSRQFQHVDTQGAELEVAPTWQ